MNTAIQLYTLRDLDRPLADLLELVADTSLDGVEFAGLYGTDPPEVAARLAETGLAPAGAHVPIDALDSDLDEVAETYRAIGCDTVVVPILDEGHFESAEAVEATASHLSALADRLADHDLRLCYHNHDHEFVSLEGDAERDAFDLLVAETDDLMSFELDVGWALAAGRDPAALLDDLSGRVPLVHVKDVDAEVGRPVELGVGDLDLDACVRAAGRAGSEWLIYEHDEPADPLASLSRGAEMLVSARDSVT